MTNSENIHAKFNMELVLNIWLQTFGIKIYVEHNLNFSDNIDYLERGVRDDYYYRFGLGLTYYFGNKK
jgi:curli production assembly/transport component CsgG